MAAPPAELHRWSDLIRQVLAFAVGLLVIVHAVFTPDTQIMQWLIGLLLMGVVPVDAVFRRIRNGD